MMAELRKYPRYNTSLEILYMTEDGIAVVDSEDPPTHYFGTVLDLSKGGAGLLVDEPHLPEQLLKLEGIGGSTRPVDSIVRWSQKIHGKYKIGVKFMRPPPLK